MEDSLSAVQEGLPVINIETETYPTCGILNGDDGRKLDKLQAYPSYGWLQRSFTRIFGLNFDRAGPGRLALQTEKHRPRFGSRSSAKDSTGRTYSVFLGHHLTITLVVTPVVLDVLTPLHRLSNRWALAPSLILISTRVRTLEELNKTNQCRAESSRVGFGLKLAVARKWVI
ncbi:uncharacterized protein CIMG_13600 [Coccidioides immitis RS]|uniref:Uncharacterized protein n=1 Tax=Coccidioides immitis (strain RS) TaxID=246410 RepID=J3K226_COCIM|nr:uncharacterized protein CIMG_13600 [Coccidioides immitis RS]EAS28104.3 hypothetical protein CIMG_13600 [Coccidioides immitis RS]